ncbi:MAG: TetR/AcrR family transcriptional regulator [Candidatus Binatia bacterium]|nr:TetR/AcrR family transcriptional regulator [Candidatus Binatia bacterium]
MNKSRKKRELPKKGSAYHHGQLKDALKSAALEIVRDQGERSLTFRELAKRTGVTHTAPYSHFKNKEELLTALATDGFVRLRERLEAASDHAGEDSLSRLAGSAQGYIDFALEDRALHEIAFGGLGVLEPKSEGLRQADDEAFGFVRSLFESASNDGSIRDLPSEKLTLVLWAALLGCAEAHRNGIARRRGIDELDDLVAVLLEVLLAGLVPR